MIESVQFILFHLVFYTHTHTSWKWVLTVPTDNEICFRSEFSQKWGLDLNYFKVGKWTGMGEFNSVTIISTTADRNPLEEM